MASIIKAVCSMLLFTFSVITVASDQFSNEKDVVKVNTPNSYNSYVLQEKVNEVRSDIKLIKTTIRELEVFDKETKESIIELEQLQFNKAETQEKLKRLKQLVDNLKKSIPDPTSNEEKPLNPNQIKNINKLLEGIQELFDPFWQIAETKSFLRLGMQLFLRASSPSYTTATTTAIESAAEKIEPVEEYFSGKAKEIIAAEEEVRSSISSDNGNAIVTSALFELLNIIDKLAVEELEQEFANLKTTYKLKLGEVQKSIKDNIEYQKIELTKKDAELSDAFTKIEKTQEKQTSVDTKLIYAVYGMIATLLFMFLSLKIFQTPVAVEILKRRSLVEVVGMAFMLITIIILGTGGKLNQEALGTLLGTIAGYVFGRLGHDRESSDVQAEKLPDIEPKALKNTD
ncbi:hypothetical protein [Rheinheimera sp.]|uniref:hypothetical protein n=1 Tax=Rheinheimera sp. TaxID=1869214 RepID=UPI00260889AA|nr:hypothetical protein [Rheinheimera sp.]MCA1929588.1 hypothetical protein [Rheinheimera sp.]